MHAEVMTSEQIEVNGENVHPVFQFLKSKLTGALWMDRIKWNVRMQRNG